MLKSDAKNLIFFRGKNSKHKIWIILVVIYFSAKIVTIFNCRVTINIFLCTAQIGGFAVYLLFIADNLQETLNPWLGLSWDYRIYLSMIMAPTLVLGSVRNLRFLSPVSVVANLFEFYTLAVVFYYIFRDPLPNFTSRPLFASWDQLPIFLGTGMQTCSRYFLKVSRYRYF